MVSPKHSLSRYTGLIILHIHEHEQSVLLENIGTEAIMVSLGGPCLIFLLFQCSKYVCNCNIES